MNPRQRAVGFAGGAVFLALVIYPPWVCAFSGGPELQSGRFYGPVSRAIGHHLIFAPPNSNDPAYFQALFDGIEAYLDPHFYEFRIDFVRLALLIGALAVLTVAGIILSRPV